MPTSFPLMQPHGMIAPPSVDWMQFSQDVTLPFSQIPTHIDTTNKKSSFTAEDDSRLLPYTQVFVRLQYANCRHDFL